MRHLCLLSVILMPMLSRCQLQQAIVYKDSLAKYSYLVFIHYPDSSVGAATGFFIRNSGKLFFITAFHAISGCSMSPDSPTSRTDTVEYLEIVYNHSTTECIFKKIYPGKYKTISCFSFADSADIVDIDVSEDFSKPMIYSIEKMIVPSRAASKLYPGQEVFIYGYPKQELEKLPTHKRCTMEPIEFSQHVTVLPKDSHVRGHPRHPFLNFATSPSLPVCVSGAPLFIVTKDSKKRTSIQFAGIQSQSNNEHNVGIAVKASQLLKEID